MNLSNVSTAINVASSAWSKINEVREEKARKAYAALEEAASSAAEKVEGAEIFPEARKQAGAVTQAAHARIERALAELAAARQQAADEVATKAASAKKDFKRAKKDANKVVAKVAQPKKKDKKNIFWPIAGVFALIAAVSGGLYYFLRKKETPSEEPPRVEEFGADNVQGSTLVYTSTTEDAKEAKQDAGELAEDGVEERDEELLDSLDEQLAKHRMEEDQ